MPSCLPQRFHFRGDQAQVLGHQRQRPERRLKRAEERQPGRLDPLALDRRLLLGGDRPVGLEAAEVVEADDVIKLAGAADAVDPPVEAALGQHIPAIERVAPALAGGREVVGRHAGDANGLQVLVQLEEIGVNPDVGRIHVDEDGHVAEDADSAALRQPRED